MIENGKTMIGMVIGVTNLGLPISFSVDFVRRQFGKYAPKEPDKVDCKFEICWECMLDALLGEKKSV